MVAILSEVLFGLSYVFIRMCVTEVSVFTLLSWRSMIAFIAMTICILLGFLKVDLKGKNLKPLLMLSLFQPVLYFIMETFGVRLTTASESGVIISCIPIVTMIFCTIFLKERPTGKQIIFMVVTVFGAILIGAGSDLSASGSLLGYLFLLLAMCCEGAYAVTSQSLSAFNSAEKTYAMVSSGAIFFTTCAFIEHISKGDFGQYITLPFTDHNFGICVLYLGLGCSVIAFFCANFAISTIGATKRAALAGIASLVSVLGGVFILHESFTKLQVIATALVLLGAYGVNRFGINSEDE